MCLIQHYDHREYKATREGHAGNRSQKSHCTVSLVLRAISTDVGTSQFPVGL